MRHIAFRSLIAAFTVMTAVDQVKVMAQTVTTSDLTAAGATYDTGSGLTISQTSDGEYDGSLTGGGGLTIQGAPSNIPTITLGGINTYTGPTILDNANLTMKSGSSLSSSDFSLGHGSLNVSALTDFSINNVSGSGDNAGISGPSGTLTIKNMTSGIAITSANNIDITGNVTASTEMHANNSITIEDNASLDITGPYGTLNGPATITNKGTIIIGSSVSPYIGGTIINEAGASLEDYGVISMSKALINNGDATATLSYAGGQITNNGSMSLTVDGYLGGGVVNNGQMIIKGDSSDGAKTSVEQIYSQIDQTQISPNVSNSNTIAGFTDNSTSDTTINGIVSNTGAGSISGLVTLNDGASLVGNYSGQPTTVTGTVKEIGESLIFGNYDISSGGVVNGNAASGYGFTLDGGSISGSLNVASGFSVTAQGGTVGSLTLSGGNTINGTLIIENAKGSISGSVSGNGSIDIKSGTESFNGAYVTAAIDVEKGAVATGDLSGPSNVRIDGLFNTSDAMLGSLQGSGSIKIGDITAGRAMYFGGDPSNIMDNTIFSGSISDADNVDNSGKTAIVFGNGLNTIFTGTNTYTGNTIITSGTLTLNGGSLKSNVGVVGGALNIIGSDTSIGSLYGSTSVALSKNLTINASRATLPSLYSYSGIIGGNGGLTIANGVEKISAQNTYTGTTTVMSGAELDLVGNSATLSDNGGISFSSDDRINGTLDASGLMAGFDLQSLSGSGSVILGANTMSIDNASSVFSGSIKGTGGVAVAGGVQEFDGANTYTGATSINAGGVIINGDESAATGITTVSNGAFIRGNGVIGGNVVINDGGSLMAGTDAQTGTLTINGNLVIGNATTSFRENTASGSTGNDLIAVAGDLTLGGVINMTNTNNVYFGDGLYRLYTYGGSLSGSAVLSASDLDTAKATLETGVDHQVSALITGATHPGGGGPIIFWNGSGKSGVIEGGDGVWGSAKNWTDVAASVDGSHASGTLAIFTGNAGTVQVSSDASQVSGLQFANAKGQYFLTGGMIKAAGPNLSIRVGDGTSSGSAISARINSQIADNGSAVTVSKTDLGTLYLSGDNTYTGGTQIAAGAIGVESNNALGSGAVAMSDGTALDLSNGVTLANDITLSGDPTFNVDAGTSTVSGAISDGTVAGDLVKDGTGTLILSGVSTYTGNTTVNAGLLDVTGAIKSSNITVDGGALGGSGSVSNTTVQAGGIVDTTSGLGFSGDLNVAGGTLIARQSGVVNVAGNATIGSGTLDYRIDSVHLGQTNTVLQANAVSGQFSHVNLMNGDGDAYTYISPTVDYLANQIDLTYARNTTSFGGGSRNQNAVGVALDNMTGGEILNAAEIMSTAQVRQAENMLSGEMLSSERTALIQNTDIIRSAVFDRLASADCAYASAQAAYDMKTGKRIEHGCYAQGAVMWGQAFGSLGSNGAQGGMHTLSHSNAGFIMGVDRMFGDWRVGTVVSYGRSNMNTNALASSAHSNDVTVGVYGGKAWGDLSLRMGASYTWNMLSSKRTIASPGMNFGKANADHLGGTAQAFSEIAYRFNVNGVNIEPYAGVAYVNQQMTGYHETGSIAALHVRGSDVGTTFASVGSRISKDWRLKNGADLTPYASLGYRHAFGHMTPSADMRIAGGNDMDVGGTLLTQDAVTTEVGVNYKMNDRIALKIGYRGQYGQHYNDNGITGSFSLKF